MFSDVDFLRRRKKDDGFLVRTGGVSRDPGGGAAFVSSFGNCFWSLLWDGGVCTTSL